MNSIWHLQYLCVVPLAFLSQPDRQWDECYDEVQRQQRISLEESSPYIDFSHDMAEHCEDRFTRIIIIIIFFLLSRPGVFDWRFGPVGSCLLRRPGNLLTGICVGCVPFPEALLSVTRG